MNITRDFKLTNTIKNQKAEIKELQRTISNLNAKVKKYRNEIIKINGITMRIINDE